MPAMPVFRTEADIHPTVSTSLPKESCRLCDFCSKLVDSKGSEILERLSGENNFFCSYCLRTKFYKRKSVLGISFRAVFAYLYYELYLPQQQVHFSEIEDLIDRHFEAGNTNPLFSYDPDTMIWYIDYARVGGRRHWLAPSEIKETVSSIVKVLSLTTLFGDIQCSKFESKYCSAIENFRPSKTRRFVIPTLRDCGVPDPKGQNWEKHRDFVRSNMTIRPR